MKHNINKNKLTCKWENRCIKMKCILKHELQRACRVCTIEINKNVNRELKLLLNFYKSEFTHLCRHKVCIVFTLTDLQKAICIYRMWANTINSHHLNLFFCFPQESAEHYNRMLSERAQEIQELRKQLSDRQQQLATAEKQSSTTAQGGYLETAELRALLAEKDSIINVSSSGIKHNYSAVKFAWLRSLTGRGNENSQGGITGIICLSFILPSNDLVAYLIIFDFWTKYIISTWLCCYLYDFAEAPAVWSGEGPVSGRDEAEGGAGSRVGAQTNDPDHAREVGREGRWDISDL